MKNMKNIIIVGLLMTSMVQAGLIDKAKKAASKVADTTKKVAEKVADTAKQTASTVTDTAKQAASKISDVASDAADAVTDLAASASNATRKGASNALVALVKKSYTSCMIDPAAKELEDTLNELKAHMPTDRPLVILLNSSTWSKYQEQLWADCNELVKKIFGEKVYYHGRPASAEEPIKPWPTQGELKGRVIVFLDCDPTRTSQVKEPLVIHASGDWIFDTHYNYTPSGADLRDQLTNKKPDRELTYPKAGSATETEKKQSPDGAYCGIRDNGEALYNLALPQGAQSNRLYLIHHYLTDNLAGNEKLAQQVNKYELLKNRISTCHKQIRFWPTIIQLDFVNQNHSEIQQFVDELNAEILAEYQKAHPEAKSIDDLPFNNVVHIIAHNGTSWRSPGEPLDGKYAKTNDRLQLGKLKRVPGVKLDKLAVNDASVSPESQIKDFHVDGFKIPLHMDPKVGDSPSSSAKIPWACHGRASDDVLLEDIPEAFGVSA